MEEKNEKESIEQTVKNSTNQLRLYDTLNNEYFTVSSDKPLRIYICGPTVYTHTHIGHLKTYMTFDIIRRTLEDYFRVPIQYMMNITNVDNKIIRATYEKYYGMHVNLTELKEDDYLDNQKFADYADFWEKDFFDMMDLMKIKRPNIVSRVTEYMDEIIEFADAIDKNGYAFCDNGSLYFYGTKYNNIKDEQGEFSQNPKHPNNFVLLKKAKPYEPGWMSKWGNIRPGWHLECSAMSSNVFGSHFDIHCGGIDLMSPHHKNEIEQSNARFYYSDMNGNNYQDNHQDNHQNNNHRMWVNHFMHMGHLNIEGLKMSRSLKNFTTVSDITKQFSHNEIRMLFLIHTWSAPMDYSEETMKHATTFVNYFENFFAQAKSILLRPTTKINKKFVSYEIEQMKNLEDTQKTIDACLRDNINTHNVIKTLQALISNMFVYVTNTEKHGDTIADQIVTNVVMYVDKILSILGLDFGDKQVGKEDQLLKVISDIRTGLRIMAKDISNKSKPVDKTLVKEISQNIFQLTDMVRDKMLPDIGITLTDAQL